MPLGKEVWGVPQREARASRTKGGYTVNQSEAGRHTPRYQLTKEVVLDEDETQEADVVETDLYKAQDKKVVISQRVLSEEDEDDKLS